MVRNTEEAMKVAANQNSNVPGECQKNVRTWYDAPSAGDRDGDGDADAVDGWLSEPSWARHAGDRNPPPGYPIAFSGGSKGYGHRAQSGVGGRCRSTDMDNGRYRPGHTGWATIEEIERSMGVRYLGWTSTISGLSIPEPPHKVTRLEKFHDTAPAYDLLLLDRAAAAGRTGIADIVRQIDAQVKSLPKDRRNTRVKQFVTAYKNDRVLRMGLLTKAVMSGRVGKVRKVRNELRKLIAQLPKH